LIGKSAVYKVKMPTIFDWILNWWISFNVLLKVEGV
jgi:hypothetical protein